MNLNNLENLKQEMKALGFSDKLQVLMEEQMRNDIPQFHLNDSIAADKGQVDFTLHFKQSGQSDYYYLNRYEVAHNKGKGLEEGQKYMVIVAGADGKNTVKRIENLTEAIDHFKSQNGAAELSVGKDPQHRKIIANMENGKVNFISNEFRNTYFSKPVTQNIWVDKGRGFTAQQSANLIQGRSVYRDDLVKYNSGESYKAWVKLDLEKGKDDRGNFQMQQFMDPQYGYDLKHVLNEYRIKELDDPSQRQKLEAELKNGNRALISTVKDGKEVKLQLEAVPRYGNLNFFTMDGKLEKRNQFEKVQAKENTFDMKVGQSKDKELSTGQELSR
ncbi:hypothetical protein [Pedobacter gandavensis]|uniref:DUF3945 domain-containing protein n=1 Tax=Pedobacter gandavensis TaxID=2679963 RepID=A0ABR6EQM4_9SPHI|nr:hypothetical protein [Pedobacter gandavensis]MBB2147357.1 hypothetical protein [Pedobacter gandavensis]